MASNTPAAKQSSRWGSFLSGAVAGLESRLDTILADENDASAKSKAADSATKEVTTSVGNGSLGAQESAATENLAPSPAKSTRLNDRLQERLAKALINKTGTSQAGSELSSPNLRPTSSVSVISPRTSLGSRPSFDLPGTSTPDVSASQALPAPENTAAPLPAEINVIPPPDELQASILPINPAQSLAQDSALASTRPQAQAEICPAPIESAKASLDQAVPALSARELQAEVFQLRAERADDDRRKQEEMDTVLERVDALQAKLQYLARETVAAAKEANGSASRGSLEQQLAEKDERIALLMEEGTNLSKAEMRHLANIRKLSAKAAAEEKAASELRRTVERMKRSESDLKSRIARLEQNSKADGERINRLSAAESQLLAVTLELSSKEATAADLKRRLDVAEARTESLEAAATSQTSLVADTRKIGDLEEELANAAIERKLAEDRARLESQRLLQVLEQQKDKARATELELKTEITALEARMEALRLRAEEVTSDRTEDSQAKLLRQMEFLQTQYALAADNWRTIEGSLNSRLTAVEKERDEGFRRENETRKKAREVGLRCRRLEEELDGSTDKTSVLTNDLAEQKDLVSKLETRLQAAEKAAEEARGEFESQRQTMEADFAARLESQRSRNASISASTTQRSKRAGSPVSLLRKSSATENTWSNPVRRGPHRYPTNDSFASLSMFDRSVPRRPSGMPSDFSRGHSPVVEQISSPVSMSVSGRKQSGFAFGYANGSQSYSNHMQGDTPPTPSIATTTDAGGASPAMGTTGNLTPTTTANKNNVVDDEDTFSRHSETAADIVSATTVHTGPSVALVERMSSSIRRLEAEKAAHRDEVARLAAQRDEARDTAVALLREAEGNRAREKQAGEVSARLDALNGRYEACLEMLGEREEEVEELRGDLGEMKRIYKELAAQMGRS